MLLPNHSDSDNDCDEMGVLVHSLQTAGTYTYCSTVTPV
jgi:hypothetical protein